MCVSGVNTLVCNVLGEVRQRTIVKSPRGVLMDSSNFDREVLLLRGNCIALAALVVRAPEAN